MNLQAQNYFDELDPNDLRNIVRELQIRLAKLERSTLKVGSLDHLSNDMGEQEVGTVNNLTARGEMKTFYFATDNQLAVGGTILVCKDAGKTAAGIAAADTTVDFGKAMTVSDWVKFQGPDINGTNAVERMLVGSLVSGTLYNVTRNVDGSGANDWANAAPFAVIGQSGDSRIELVAGASASIQLITQGATWNAYTVQASMSTVEGAIKFGGITGSLDSSGIAIRSTTGTLGDPNKYRILSEDGSTVLLEFYTEEAGADPLAYINAFYRLKIVNGTKGTLNHLGNFELAGGLVKSAAGFIGLGAASPLTIDASGQITVTRNYHTIDTAGGAATDDLDTIIGGAEGDVLVLHSANNARDPTIRHGVGNIYLPSAANFTFLTIRAKVTLIKRGSVWEGLSVALNA